MSECILVSDPLLDHGDPEMYPEFFISIVFAWKKISHYNDRSHAIFVYINTHQFPIIDPPKSMNML